MMNMTPSVRNVGHLKFKYLKGWCRRTGWENVK